MVGYNQNQPNVWGSFAGGLEIGGALRRRDQQDAYGEAYQQSGFEGVRDAAGGFGDIQTAQSAQGTMDEQEETALARATRSAQIAQRLWRSLTPLDENTRRERLTQLAPQLEQYGFDAETVAGVDTSDAGWAALGQSLDAAVGQFQEFESIDQDGSGATIGYRRDGSSVVLREAPPPAWQQIPQDQLPAGARFGQRNTRTGQADIDWATSSGSGMGENQYSMLNPGEIEELGLPPGSYQRNNATGQVTVVGRTRGQYTEGASSAAQFASRMAAAHNTLVELEDLGVDRVGVYAAAFGAGSEEERRIRQAQREFVNAILRRESGAVISDSEFASAEQQYFPTPGDSPAVIEQKRQARQRSLQGLINASQGAYEEWYGEGSGSEIPPPQRPGSAAGAIAGAAGAPSQPRRRRWNSQTGSWE